MSIRRGVVLLLLTFIVVISVEFEITTTESRLIRANNEERSHDQILLHAYHSVIWPPREGDGDRKRDVPSGPDPLHHGSAPPSP